jgi:hypothetical protein
MYISGFLRPGFPYRKLVDYLYGRVLEHDEIGADTESVLTRDWKIKLAAAIVPRGLEVDSLFYESLRDQLLQSLRSKFEDEVKLAIGQSELSPAVAMAVSNDMNEIARHWKRSRAAFASEHEFGVSKGQRRVVEETARLIKSVMYALQQTMDYSVELRQGNLRISSELFNQPKPVDSVVDDFAVEAQVSTKLKNCLYSMHKIIHNLTRSFAVY